MILYTESKAHAHTYTATVHSTSRYHGAIGDNAAPPPAIRSASGCGDIDGVARTTTTCATSTPRSCSREKGLASTAVKPPAR